MTEHEHTDTGLHAAIAHATLNLSDAELAALIDAAEAAFHSGYAIGERKLNDPNPDACIGAGVAGAIRVTLNAISDAVGRADEGITLPDDVKSNLQSRADNAFHIGSAIGERDGHPAADARPGCEAVVWEVLYIAGHYPDNLAFELASELRAKVERATDELERFSFAGLGAS